MQSEFEIKRAEKLRREAGIEIDDKIDPNIPIFESIYAIDGELHYEIHGENIPQKLSEYSLEAFQSERKKD